MEQRSNIEQKQLDEAPLKELAVLLARVGRRAERRTLCDGLLKFLRRGFLTYGACCTTSGPRMAYTARANVLESVGDILADAEHNRVAYALLHSVATLTVVFVVSSARGKIDILFSGTEAKFGLIHARTRDLP